MATKTRRLFTDEFKQEAVSLLGASGRPLTQVAVELGVQPSMLRNWRYRGCESGAVRAVLSGRGHMAYDNLRLVRSRRAAQYIIDHHYRADGHLEVVPGIRTGG